MSRYLGVAWDVKASCVDPRLFGLGCARARCYGIGWKKSSYEWSKLISLERVLGALKAQPVMKADDYFFLTKTPEMKLSPAEDSQFVCNRYMLLLPKNILTVLLRMNLNPVSTTNTSNTPVGCLSHKLTYKSYVGSAAQEENRKAYMNYSRDWQVADLSQLVRTGRGRTNTVEGHLPTLTTNSGRLYSKVVSSKKNMFDRFNKTAFPLLKIRKDNWSRSESSHFPIPLQVKKRCLTPAEMLASQCIPTSSAQSRASGSPKLKMNEASPAALAKAAGNGMSVPCVGAFIIASIMCIDPVPWNSLLLKRCVLIQNQSG